MEIRLQQVEMFRTIYALCDILKDRDASGSFKLKATHYACVLEAGRYPVWGIFSARSNKLVQLLGGRAMVESQYPTKSWRRKQATWSLNKVQEILDHDEKQAELRKQVQASAVAVADRFLAAPINPGFPTTPLQERMQSSRG